MKHRGLIISLFVIVLINVLVGIWRVRIDLSSENRYSLQPSTKQFLKTIDSPAEITLYLTGNLNSGFTKLKNATSDIIKEMSVYAPLHCSIVDPIEMSDSDLSAINLSLYQESLHPISVFERQKDGRQITELVYPFAKVQVKGKAMWVELLVNQRGKSGAENLNTSVENLEYQFVNTLQMLCSAQRKKIALIEGHGELDELHTADLEHLLAKRYDVYRGTITDEADCLNPFAAIIIADPQLPFSEKDKFVIDQYIMQGGAVFWAVNGVQFSSDVLTDEGFTPALPLDLNLTDLLFRYSLRVNNRLLQDLQCLSEPVDVSQNPQIPQYQPMPLVFSPLLLTSSESTITRNVSPVSTPFASDIDIVGEDDSLKHIVLLASSEYATLVPTPSKIDLEDMTVDPSRFTLSYLPVAVAAEGQFSSLYAHRAIPQGVKSESKKNLSATTRQIVVAAGSVLRNERSRNETLPMGYDRYSRTQFGNRDFMNNSILYLTKEDNIISLKNKTLELRLLNQQLLNKNITIYQTLAIAVPLFILALAGGLFLFIRKKFIV